MTLPSCISAAAALVTAGVTRFVAPVWSFGPHGEAGTSFLQSACAEAAVAKARTRRAESTTAVAVLIQHSFQGGRRGAAVPMKSEPPSYERSGGVVKRRLGDR